MYYNQCLPVTIKIAISKIKCLYNTTLTKNCFFFFVPKLLCFKLFVIWYIQYSLWLQKYPLVCIMIVTCYPLSMSSYRRSEVKYRKHEMTCSGNSNRAIVGKALCSIGHDFAIRWSLRVPLRSQHPLKVDIIELVQGHKWKIPYLELYRLSIEMIYSNSCSIRVFARNL